MSILLRILLHVSSAVFFFPPSEERLRLVTIPSLPIDCQLRWWQHDFSRTTVLKSISKCLKTPKLQFVVFKIFTSAYLQQIAREIMLFLCNNLHEIRITVSQAGRNFGSARYLKF